VNTPNFNLLPYHLNSRHLDVITSFTYLSMLTTISVTSRTTLKIVQQVALQH